MPMPDVGGTVAAESRGEHLARRAGTALAWKAFQLGGVKLIFILRTLILARLLSPDDFGLLAIASVAVGVMVSLTDFGMIQALVHEQHIDDAHYDSAWTINMVRGLAVSAVLMGIASPVAALFAEPRAAEILRVLAFRPLMDASASVKVAELMRTLQYRRLAAISLPGVVVETMVSVLLAIRFGVWALVAGALAGSVAGVIASYAFASYRPRVRLNRQAMLPLVRYGRWVFLTGLMAVAASSLTQVVISRRLGAAELGLYFLAVKLAFLPHEAASQVMGDVAFSVYARIQNEPVRVARAFRSIFLAATTVLLPAYVLLICVAPRLVDEVLGQSWRGTEPLIQLLALVGIIGLFGDTSGPLFRGLGYPNWILGIEVWQSSVVIMLLWGLTGSFGVIGAAMAWLIATFSSQVLSFVLAHRLCRTPLAGATAPLAAILLASGAGALAAVTAGRLFVGVSSLAFAISAAVSVTVAVLWFLDHRFELGLRSVLSQAFPQVASLLGLAPLAP